MCVVCHKKTVYGSNGKKVLMRHQPEDAHKAAVRALQHTVSLPGATTTTKARASKADCVCKQKIRICAFIAEHDLSLTMSQPLVELVKSVTEDKSALSRMTLSNAHASYLCTSCCSLQNQIISHLQRRMFSLNTDESTNANMDSVLNVLVRYFDEDIGIVLTQHLA